MSENTVQRQTGAIKSSAVTEHDDLYIPVQGGWRLTLTKPEKPAGNDAQRSPRSHCCPLFPPSDFELLWGKNEIKKDGYALHSTMRHL